MAYSGQPRRAKPTGNSPVITAAASNNRKPNSSPPTYPASSEPAVKWVSQELNPNGPPNRGITDSDEQGVAWDWQSREWVADRLPPNTADTTTIPVVDPSQAPGMTNSAVVIRKPVQRFRQGGWVSELEGISEKEVIVDSGVARARRDNPVARGRRKGFYVADVQSRRKPSQREVLLLRREKNPRRNPSDKAIILTNGEPSYLKPRGPSSLVDGDSNVNYMQSPNMRFAAQKLGFVSDGPGSHTNMSAKQHPELLFKTYRSANEVDHNDDSDDTESFHSERSACGMPWHWPGNSQRLKQDVQTESAGGCFPVPKRSARRNRLGYKFSSERSVSSFDSDSESVPLMTDPEQFHEYSEDFAASSVELSNDTPRLVNMDEFQFKRYGKLEGQGFGYLSSGECLDVNMRKQRDSVVRKHRSLSQKYRPKAFKDFIGQAMVMESLSNAILRDKVAPVYLFHGPRGTGKTTAAKIFTAAMNCLSIEELRPCGLCKECSSFNAGQNHDVKEVDAAGHNDVESMRLLLTNILQPPASSRYKVFIVDDCHSLNAEAWNALLKSLEEPPGFVVFILITTDLEQLPRTAMSRCQKFMFLRIKEVDIIHRLRKLALQEKVEIDHEALLFIASRSDGSFRDAENMLDQLSLLGNRVTLAMVQEMVGLIPDDKLVKLLESALSADTITTVNTIRELMESGVEPLALTSQLAVLITDILAGKKRVVGYITMKVREEEHLRLKQALRILSESEKQLRSCSDRTTWLTAAFLQFAPNEPCLLPSSSRSTSVTPSPITLFDTSEKEILDLDFSGMRKSWGGEEKWDLYSPLQPDAAPSPLQGPRRIENVMRRQLDSDGQHFSGPFFDNNRIWACGHAGACAQECKTGVCSGLREKVQRESNTTSPSTMDSIWRKVLQGSRSNVLRQLLQGEGRLVSLAVTEAFSIACLEFQHPEHKAMAERAKTSIANAFQMALGCPVELEISLSGVQGEGNLEDGPFINRNPEHQNGHINAPVDQEIGLSQGRRRMRSGSIRDSSSSFRNSASAIPSPLWQNVEPRRPRHAFEIEGRSSNKGVFSKDLDFHERRRSKDGAAWALKPYQQSVVDAQEGERSRSLKHVQGIAADIRSGEDNSSDSEGPPDRDAPGALCWKGTQTKDSKGKHQMLRRRRRRRGRLLLRLVPCAKGGGRKQEQQEGSDQ